MSRDERVEAVVNRVREIADQVEWGDDPWLATKANVLRRAADLLDRLQAAEERVEALRKAGEHLGACDMAGTSVEHRCEDCNAAREALTEDNHD